MAKTRLSSPSWQDEAEPHVAPGALLARAPLATGLTPKASQQVNSGEELDHNLGLRTPPHTHARARARTRLAPASLQRVCSAGRDAVAVILVFMARVSAKVRVQVCPSETGRCGRDGRTT